jgi:hypothetical protein
MLYPAELRARSVGRVPHSERAVLPTWRGRLGVRRGLLAIMRESIPHINLTI